MATTYDEFYLFDSRDDCISNRMHCTETGEDGLCDFCGGDDDDL